MKKILQLGLIILMSIVVTSATAEVKPAYADCRSFLGMKSWDCGVSIPPTDESSIQNTIWTIVANVADALITLASYLTLGFIIFGGYKYMFAKGDPGKVAEGKKTLFASFIGLAITVMAKAIVNTILYAMLKGSAATEAEGDIVFWNMVDWVIGIAGLVATIFVVYGGITYMTSAGDAGKLTKAKNTIIYALIGMLIVGLSIAIENLVKSNIDKANSSSLVIEKMIAKEKK